MIADFFWCGYTIGAYALGIVLQRLLRGSSLVHPVLVAMLLVVQALWASGTPYADYAAATLPISLLLAPATVALGIPLAQNLHLAGHAWRAVTAGLLAGCLGSMLTGAALVKALGGSDVLMFSMLPKSATSPISLAVARTIGGDPGLSAALAIVGGVLAAVGLVAAMRIAGVSSHPAIGLAAGTAGSGVGTARAAQLSQTAAAFAALGIGMNGLLTALFSPAIAALLP